MECPEVSHDKSNYAWVLPRHAMQWPPATRSAKATTWNQFQHPNSIGLPSR